MIGIRIAIVARQSMGYSNKQNYYFLRNVIKVRHISIAVSICNLLIYKVKKQKTGKTLDFKTN
jgi:hypothetical protein